jgi:nucleoside-diphosphate-sugar epimerase
MPEPASIPSLPCAPDAVDTFLSEPREGALEVLGDVHGDILVLGAGGKMGLHLCRLLREGMRRLGKANTVWAASRFQSLAGREAYEGEGIRTLVGDFEDPAFLAGLPECPVVFFLVGAKFGTAANPDLLRRINVEVPKAVAERFARSRLVVFSTGCVYAFTTPSSGGSTEHSPTAPVGDYARSCLGREQAFADASRRHGNPVVLVRLNYAVEFRYGVPVDVAGKIWRGEPIDVTMGYVNVIWQNDALNHIVQCLRLAASPAVPINITGPAMVPVRELAARLGRLLGRPPRIVGEEAPTAWLSDASRSHRLFGPPAVTLDEMLAWVSAWVMRGGDTFNKPTGFEKRDGNF